MLLDNRVLLKVPYDHRHGLGITMKLNTKLITTPEKIKSMNIFTLFEELEKFYIVAHFQT